jgi:hypothetical protein
VARAGTHSAFHAPLRSSTESFGTIVVQMRHLNYLASVITGAILLLAGVSQGGARAAAAAKQPLILAHYMPWFEAKPAGRRWGWHWTMNAFNPQEINGGQRSIASHYYPLIGPYDSGDPAVIEYHLLLMKLAGIHGVIVDWYGLSDFFDYPTIHRNTGALLESAAKIELLVGICYEDQTITKLVEAGRVSPGDHVTHARREMEWLRANWFTKTAYLRLNGKPVLLSFGSEGLTDDEWAQVFNATEDVPLYLSEHRRRSVAAGTFDWPRPQFGLGGLDTYYQSVEGEPVFMPVAFPRFHDIYKEGKATKSYPRIPDDRGRTFMLTFERALNSGAPLVQIATWNDWGEGTVVEPSKEFGYRDLEIIQRSRRKLDTDFGAKPEDLRLPHRLWLLRGQQARQPHLRSKLDDIAHLLASGNIPGARSALKRIEAKLQLEYSRRKGGPADREALKRPSRPRRRSQAPACREILPERLTAPPDSTQADSDAAYYAISVVATGAYSNMERLSSDSVVPYVT